MKRYEDLARLFIAKEGEDVVLQRVYVTLCKPPHDDNPSVTFMHRRCSGGLAKTRALLAELGFELRLGALKNSYRAHRTGGGASCR